MIKNIKRNFIRHEGKDFVLVNHKEEKSALEMFKELGYYLQYKKVSDITNITYIKGIFGELRKVISFNRYKNETIDVTINTYLLHGGKQSTYLCNDLNKKELEAINKQIDELEMESWEE